jgi:hypothetical protein
MDDDAFEWDNIKADANLRKHKISFQENTIVAKRLPDGTLVEVLPGGSTRRFPPDRTDWAALSAMTDTQINAAALSDPDNPPLTPEREARLKRVPPVKVMRRAMRLTRYHAGMGR